MKKILLEKQYCVIVYTEMQGKEMISITILTKNCQDTLVKTLESVRRFPEVVIVDTGSTDNTLSVAAQYPNVKLFHFLFEGFGPTHNLASSAATHDWIFSVDSDEIVSQELVQEILSLSLDTNKVYAILRHNFFNEKRILWCGGWHPDWVVRLYNKKTTCFTDAEVHEKIIDEYLEKCSLQHPLYHTPYRTMSDFLSKMQIYSSLFAKQHQHKKHSSLIKAIGHSWAAFFKSYILKRGFLGGKEGFIISLYNGHTTFYKYLKLAEINHER